MDLEDLSIRDTAEAGVELELNHPTTAEPLGWFLTLRGTDSDAFRDQMIANTRAARARLIAEKRAERTAKEIEADGIALMVACTVGWRGITVNGGGALEYSSANAERLYRETWIRQQADAFIGERANFLPRSGTNS